jgi:hypothetical protein
MINFPSRSKSILGVIKGPKIKALFTFFIIIFVVVATFVKKILNIKMKLTLVLV